MEIIINSDNLAFAINKKWHKGIMIPMHVSFKSICDNNVNKHLILSIITKINAQSIDALKLVNKVSFYYN